MSTCTCVFCSDSNVVSAIQGLDAIDRAFAADETMDRGTLEFLIRANMLFSSIVMKRFTASECVSAFIRRSQDTLVLLRNKFDRTTQAYLDSHDFDA